MARLVDNLIAFKILKMLVTPFDQTDAYNLGIVDAQGKTIRKSSALTTNAEKDSYNYLTRLVFGLKKIINKLPGGESRMKSLIAALWLVKEQYQTNGKLTNALLEERFVELLQMMDNRVSLVEEEIIVKKFLEEDGVAGIANTTGAAVSTDQPKIYPKDVKKYKKGNSSLLSMTRRLKPVEMK
jgi:hypothetical protein